MMLVVIEAYSIPGWSFKVVRWRAGRIRVIMRELDGTSGGVAAQQNLGLSRRITSMII